MSGWPSRRRSHETTRRRVSRNRILARPSYGVRSQAGTPPTPGGLIVVLIGMAVATTIFLSVLKLIAVQRQSVELQTRQIQAGWLAESAVQRAAARLSAEANYRGETWNISAQDIGGRDGATIAIRVDDVPGKPDRRTVHVEADYPDDPYQRARQVREVIVAVKAESSNK